MKLERPEKRSKSLKQNDDSITEHNDTYAAEVTAGENKRRSARMVLPNHKEVYLGQSSQEWTNKNLWKTAFKKFKGIWSAVPFLLWRRSN